MGKLIVIEGLDGSGKSTQELLLREKLAEKGATLFAEKPIDILTII